MTARRKKLPALLAAAALMAGWGANAQAGVIAQSVLSLTNFTFLDAGGNPLSVNALGGLVFQDSSDAAASLNGTTVANSTSSTAFGTLDLPQQRVGSGVFGENDYSHHSVQTVTVARGDTLLTGSPLADTPIPVGATADSLAEVQLGGAGDGSSQSNLGLVATFSFTPNASGVLGVSFDADMWLKAFLTTDMGLGTTAQASSGWSIELAQGGTTLFSWTPDGVLGSGIQGGTENADSCDLTRTAAAQIPGQNVTVSCSGGFEAFTTNPLLAGTLYTLNLRHTTEADATAVAAVPEPGVVALLGIGLLGMGIGTRRNRKMAA